MQPCHHCWGLEALFHCVCLSKLSLAVFFFSKCSLTSWPLWVLTLSPYKLRKPGFHFNLWNILNRFSEILTAKVWAIGNGSGIFWRGVLHIVNWKLISTPPFHVLSHWAAHRKFGSKCTAKIFICYFTPFLKSYTFYIEPCGGRFF